MSIEQNNKSHFVKNNLRNFSPGSREPGYHRRSRPASILVNWEIGKYTVYSIHCIHYTLYITFGTVSVYHQGDVSFPPPLIIQLLGMASDCIFSKIVVGKCQISKWVYFQKVILHNPLSVCTPQREYCCCWDFQGFPNFSLSAYFQVSIFFVTNIVVHRLSRGSTNHSHQW